jgi:Cu2+-exporting ATPase
MGDAVRPDAGAAVRALQRRGWDVGILSGDDPAVVTSVGAAIGLAPDQCVGGALPEEKVRVVESLRDSRPVVMVGDGVNDAAAIAAATVGVGVHGGAEASLATAVVHLSRPGLAPLVSLVDGSRRTMKIIRHGMIFSLAYNLLGATLALTGHINPLLAALLMPASSLTVILLAWRGRSFDGAGT